MQICRQGNGHYLDGLNNQDFFFEEGNLKMITDGCSDGRFSEVGTRLFAQAFSQIDTRLDINLFERNVEKAFMKVCSIAGNKSGLWLSIEHTKNPPYPRHLSVLYHIPPQKSRAPTHELPQIVRTVQKAP